ncbi:helix-turn-helix transcriptional regulator [Pseudonocardia eucalypti]|uniref:helix-turn-helix transcriptional regulator n=1 Tax=Pseudonocardia eucalypti TaxID=648755 RepID=UPI0031E890AD
MTMTGVGGVGKTRFALRLATEVSHVFSDGVWLVELANLPATADSSLLEQTVAEAFDLSDFSAQRPRRALADYLADRHCLLVLDNCEHLAEEATALVTYLLRAAPDLHVLVTSRKLLGCAGEHMISVPPLSVPDSSAPPGGEALELLGQRAAALGVPVTPASLDSAMEICRRLDGLPLAIELAAGRMHTLSVAEVLERLEDRFRLLTGGVRPGQPAHQTLRQVVEWSHHLCSEQEQLLWERSSVFAGGFDLAAAEEVCAGAGIAAEDVLDLLTGLVRQSLLVVERRSERTRYRFLETLREYGAQLLERRGQESTFRVRHRDYYQRLAAEAADDWFSPREVHWLQWARTEMPNLRAAMEYGLSHAEPTRSLEIAINLTRLRTWFFVGWPGEGRAWLDRVLRHARGQLEDDHAAATLRLTATAFAGWLTLCQGDPRAAKEYLVAIRSAPGREDVHGAVGLFESAYALLVESDERSVEMFARVLDDLRSAGVSAADRAMVETMRSIAASFFADREVALAVSNRHLENSLQQQVVWQISWAKWAVSLARSRHADHRGGLRLARESLRAQRDIGDQWGTVWGTHVVAWVLATELRARSDQGETPDTGHVEKIARILGGAYRLRQWTGVELTGLGPFRTATVEAEQLAQDLLGERAYLRAFEQGKFTGLPRAEAYHRVLELTLDEGPHAPTPSTPPAGTPERLTEREEQIAALIARGGTNAQIAQRLVISIRTVQTHVGNILRKCGLHNRQELVAWYLREHPEP